MKNARNGHNHSSQAWYNRITNFKFECFYTLLVRGLPPLNNANNLSDIGIYLA